MPDPQYILDNFEPQTRDEAEELHRMRMRYDPVYPLMVAEDQRRGVTSPSTPQPKGRR